MLKMESFTPLPPSLKYVGSLNKWIPGEYISSPEILTIYHGKENSLSNKVLRFKERQLLQKNLSAFKGVFILSLPWIVYCSLGYWPDLNRKYVRAEKKLHWSNISTFILGSPMIDNASSFCPVRLFCCGPNPPLCETFFHSPSWLDKPARLSFNCSLDLLLISIKQIWIEISETAIGCLNFRTVDKNWRSLW